MKKNLLISIASIFMGMYCSNFFAMDGHENFHKHKDLKDTQYLIEPKRNTNSTSLEAIYSLMRSLLINDMSKKEIKLLEETQQHDRLRENNAAKIGSNEDAKKF